MNWFFYIEFVRTIKWNVALSLTFDRLKMSDLIDEELAVFVVIQFAEHNDKKTNQETSSGVRFRFQQFSAYR
jgi:hypothetical protein